MSELELLALAELEKVILQVDLGFHNVEIGVLYSGALQVEKKAVVNVALYRLIVIRVVKVVVNKCYVELESVKVSIDDIWRLTTVLYAFLKTDREVTEYL